MSAATFIVSGSYSGGVMLLGYIATHALRSLQNSGIPIHCIVSPSLHLDGQAHEKQA